MRIKNSMVLA